MTKQKDLKINEGRVLIAEFMGFKRGSIHAQYGQTYNHPERMGVIWIDQMKYNEKWDWLMPAVEKIGKLYEKAFPSNEDFIKKIMDHEDPIDKEYIDVISTSIYTPIQEVFEEVVKFIKWYNETQSGRG